MKFSNARAKLVGRCKLNHIRLNEERHFGAIVFQLTNERRQMVMLSRGVQTALSRSLFAFLRYEHRRFRFETQSDIQHFRRRGHLQIDRQIGCITHTLEVFITNVTTVFTQMDGQTVTTCAAYDFRRAEGIRMQTTARVPNGRDVIYVYAKPDAVAHQNFLRLPGFTGSRAASSGGRSFGS